MSDSEENLTELQKAFRTIDKIVSKRDRSLDAARKRILSLQDCIDRIEARLQSASTLLNQKGKGVQKQNSRASRKCGAFEYD